MKKLLLSMYFIFICAIALNILYCNAPNSGGTETGDARVVGVLYNPDGSAASYAKVKVTRWNGSPRESDVIVGLTITDKNGTYRFDSLPSDTFNILGSGDSGLSYLDSIVVHDDNAKTRIPIDTLRAAGSISGRIELEQGDDPRTVLILFLGTNTWATPDDSLGNFTVENIAEGNYRVRFLTTLDNYLPKDTTISVLAGAETKLSKPIRLIKSGLQVPSGLTAVYDTLNGFTVLTWNPVTISNLAGYVIYRNDTSSTTPVRLNEKLVTDTGYCDTVFSNLMDMTNRVYTYRLKVQDNEANLSPVYSKPFTIVTPSPTLVRTAFSWSFLQLNGDSTSINDTIMVVAEFKNSTRKNKQLCWYVDSRATVLKETAVASYTGIDTFNYAWATASPKKIFVSIRDEAGSVWWDSTIMRIVQDPPVVNAGKDTSVSLNELVALRGKAHDFFGTIIKYEWDIGNTGNFIQTSTSDTSFTAPAAQHIGYRCVLRVTDDDANQVTDTTAVNVYNGILVDIDGNKYHTVKIGNQEWSIENLRVTKFNNGMSIPLVTDTTKPNGWGYLESPAYCFYGNAADPTTHPQYGALYNWFAASAGNLAPTGWKVPSDSDWTTLENYLTANGYNYDSTTAGNKFSKSLANQTGWEASAIRGAIGNDTLKNNRSGFSAVPSGGRSVGGDFGFQNTWANWWSSTRHEEWSSLGYIRGLTSDSCSLKRAYYWVQTGISVRVVRNVP